MPDKGIVTGLFNRSDGSPIVGVTGTFTPDLTPPVLQNFGENPATTLIDPVAVTTNDQGRLIEVGETEPGVELIASIGDMISPSGWTWTLVLDAPGLPTLTTSFTVGVEEEIDLASVVRAPTNVGQAIVTWRSVVQQATAASVEAKSEAQRAFDSATSAQASSINAAGAAGTAQAAKTAAQSAAQSAAVSATEASSYAASLGDANATAIGNRAAVEEAARLAAASQTAAASSATAASSARAEAETARNAANTAAGEAANSRTQAVAAANSVTTSRANAEAAAAAAAAASTTASTAASSAESYATTASANAQTAQSAAQAATTRANEAQTHAGEAAGSASASAASQGVSATSATISSNAANVAQAARNEARSIVAQIETARGSANGFAPLDAAGKLPASMLPTSTVEFKGVWNASTNTPTLSDASGSVGDMYIISVGAVRDLGSGNIDFQNRDQLIHDGTKFQKIDNSDSVTSVAGKQGTVTLDKVDVGLGNVDDTSDANKPVSTATQTVLDDTVNGGTIVGRDLVLQKVGGGATNAGEIVPTFTIGTVTTVEEGNPATATITGTAPNQVLNLTVPKGDQGIEGLQGPPNTLSIGTVATVANGVLASATITGTSPNQTLSLSLPRGDKGDKGDIGDLMTTDQTTAGSTLTVGGTSPITQTRILSQNATVNALSTPSSAVSFTCTIIVKQDATGGRTLTWPVGLLWSEGFAPQPSTAPNSISVFHVFWTGSQWLGMKAGQNFA